MTQRVWTPAKNKLRMYGVAEDTPDSIWTFIRC